MNHSLGISMAPLFLQMLLVSIPLAFADHSSIIQSSLIDMVC